MRTQLGKTAVAGALGAALFLVVWGCNGPKPLAPAQKVSVTVSLAPSKDVQASLLGASSNTLLWSYQTGSGTGIQGQAGPLTSGSATGNIAFTLSLPAGGKNILSVQLNDAGTNQPIAIGAVSLDMTNPASGMGVSLQLGSVIRQCYILSNATPYAYYDLYDHLIYSGGSSSPPPIPADLMVIQGNVNYQLSDANGNPDITFLGNGNLVNFDYVPDSSQFFSGSSLSKNQVLGTGASGVTLDLAAGDIYCLKMANAPGDYAWIQVTNSGNYGNGVYPSFLFRISDNPYYSYFQSAADLAGSGACSSWPSSPTSFPVTTLTSPVSTGGFPAGGGGQ